MKMSTRSLVINQIARAANGNWIVNGTTWFNGIEIANSLQNLGLPSALPATLVGSAIVYTELIVSPEDIVAGTNKYTLPRPRTDRTTGKEITEITYTTSGTKQIGAEIELSDRILGVMTAVSVEKSFTRYEDTVAQRIANRRKNNSNNTSSTKEATPTQENTQENTQETEASTQPTDETIIQNVEQLTEVEEPEM